MEDEITTCEVGRCKRISAFTWYDHAVCQKHWDMHSDHDNKFCLHKQFKVKENCYKCGYDFTDFDSTTTDEDSEEK